MDLQEEFSSTVYTIFRTGEKLSVNKKENHDKEYFCLLCQDKLRTNNCSDYNAIKAINFSKSISSQKLKNCNINNKTNCCGNCSSTEEIIKEIKDLNLENNFCYGCSNIINDLVSKCLLKIKNKTKIWTTKIFLRL